MTMRLRPFTYTAPPSPAQVAQSLDRLAELLEQDLPLPVIAERMDVTGGTAANLYCQLCSMYGERP